MTLQECYSKLHGNYTEAKSRLMMDKLVEKFILKFPADNSMQMLRDAVAAQNNADAFRAAHTLKGVAANLAFTELQEAASVLTEQLRGCDVAADPILLQKVEKSYQLVIDTLAAFVASK